MLSRDTRPTFSRWLPAILLSLLPFATALNAQEGIDRSDASFRPYVGLVVGAGGLPDTFHGGCALYSDPSNGRSASLLAGFILGLPMGPFHLETRNLSRRKAQGDDCPTIGITFESGVHTLYTPLADRGSQSTSDFRLGYELPARIPVVVSLGGGWVWGNDIPFVTSGLGVRRGEKFRTTVGLFWESYRMPFLFSAQEWADYQLVRVVEEGKDHDWQHAWSFQIGIAGYIR